MRRTTSPLVLVDSELYANAQRLFRRARGRASLSWGEAVAVASRWHSPDPLCPGRAAVVRALATRDLGWA